VYDNILQNDTDYNDTAKPFKGAMSPIFDLKWLLFKNTTTKLKINIVNGLSYDT
jgi:hypothetical protein